MTETISGRDSQLAKSPRLPGPDAGAAVRDNEEATRPEHTQDCAEKILAKVNAAAAAG